VRETIDAHLPTIELYREFTEATYKKVTIGR